MTARIIPASIKTSYAQITRPLNINRKDEKEQNRVIEHLLLPLLLSRDERRNEKTLRIDQKVKTC